MSINIQENYALKSLNTFGFDVKASYFSAITHLDDLKSIAEATCNHLDKIILGGGSNMLFTRDIDAWVLKNELKGIEVIEEDEHKVLIEVSGGEIWHNLVMYTVDHAWAGIENLALIPGTVGAAPMQNIGAYGVEVKDVIKSVKFYDIEAQRFFEFDTEACEFGYRDSIFKRKYKNKIIITSVIFQLSKIQEVNTSYGAIHQELAKANIIQPTLRDVANAVISIRQSKLPDPQQIGNAGSFFKNPVIDKALYTTILDKYPQAPSYPIDAERVKVPAGWLIEQCGWKGHKELHVGVHNLQSLVLVHFGGGTGSEIWDLSTKIIKSVVETFGIELEREVQVY